MSFSSDTKNELAHVTPKKKCCELAEIAAFIRASGSIGLAGGGRYEIRITTASPAIARHLKMLIRDYFRVETELEIENGSALKKGHSYILKIGPDQKSDSILRETGLLLVREGNNYLADGIYDELIRKKCCRKAYLRGIFLAAGSVTDPERSYHLEFALNRELLANDLRRLINTFDDLSAKISTRKGTFVVYMKNSQYISDTLAIMGAHTQVLKFENIKLRKELVNEATRMTNCDTANTDRTLSASEKQINAIRKIQREGAMGRMPEKLQELARLRMENPELSLTQLGEKLDPPLKKAGVNGRMKRILEYAGTLK